MMKMVHIFRSVFGPDHGNRDQIALSERHDESMRRLDSEVNRFEETVRELLNRNDSLTGRHHAP